MPASSTRMATRPITRIGPSPSGVLVGDSAGGVVGVVETEGTALFPDAVGKAVGASKVGGASVGSGVAAVVSLNDTPRSLAEHPAEPPLSGP